MEEIFRFSSEVLPTFGIGIVRTYFFMWFTPIFSFKGLRPLFTTSIVAAVSLYMFPVHEAKIIALNLNIVMIVFLVLKEAILGALLGMIVTLPFWLFESVGGLSDNQRGILLGGQINPSLGQQDFTPIGYFLKVCTGVILFYTFGMHSLMKVLWDSYSFWGISDMLPAFSKSGFVLFLELIRSFFGYIIIYAAPLVFFLLLIDYLFGLLSIFSPQIQATILAIPVKCVFGLVLLIYALPHYVTSMTSFFDLYNNIKFLFPLLDGSK